MTKDQLAQLEAHLAALVDYRRTLGGFDTNAEAILTLSEALLLLTQHLLESRPKNAKGKQRKR